MVMSERSRRQLSSAYSSNGNVGHRFASDGITQKWEHWKTDEEIDDRRTAHMPGNRRGRIRSSALVVFDEIDSSLAVHICVMVRAKRSKTFLGANIATRVKRLIHPAGVDKVVKRAERSVKRPSIGAGVWGADNEVEDSLGANRDAGEEVDESGGAVDV